MNWHIIRLINKVQRVCDPGFIRQRLVRFKNKKIRRNCLNAINLSLSSLCSAECVYCPTNRGKRIKQKNMPYDIVDRILTEITSRSFKRFHNIEIISVGENGDAFLNKDVMAIVRSIKKAVPYVKLICYTNFRTFSEEKIQEAMKSRVFDALGCNIDASSPADYFRVKKTELEIVKKNILYFLKCRKRYWRDVPLLISSLTLYRYMKAIKEKLGVTPIHLKDVDIASVRDDFDEIKKEFEPLLDHPKDKMLRMPATGWAEREQIDVSTIDYQKMICPVINRVRREAFISPDGSWYACCWDSNNELVFGNVANESLHEIFQSKKRDEFIRLLEEKRFNEVNGPCRTVNCCMPLDNCCDN